MRYIALTRGLKAIVDDEDYVWLTAYKWRAQPGGNGSFYAGRTPADDPAGLILMHREILGFGSDSSIEVDHKDGDGLNNRRRNLRKATKSQNHQNQKRRADSKTGFKGVTRYLRRPNLWRARIAVDGKRIHLGCFDSPELAAKAYDKAARFYFGEFARPNFGEPTQLVESGNSGELT